MTLNKSTRLTYGYVLRNQYGFKLVEVSGIEDKGESVSSRNEDYKLYKNEVKSIELTKTLHKKFGKNWKSVHTELIETMNY